MSMTGQLALALPFSSPSLHQPEPSTQDKIADAVRRIGHLLCRHPVVVAWSGGKDSTAVAILTLIASRRLLTQGVDHFPIMLLTTDTLVENSAVIDHKPAHAGRARHVGECPVVAAVNDAGPTACGARMGCHTCTAVTEDKSL